MRILKKHIEHKNHGGMVVVSLEKEDDMYHLYNIINNGDRITSSTVRAVIHESNSGSTTKQRMKITLKITVEYITFDTDSCSLHIKGKCCEENEYVKIGQYHTIDIELNQTFTVEKECWDMVHLKILDDACDSTNTAEIAAVMMQDGLANICIVGNTMTLVKCKIEKHLPKKRQSNEIYMKARNKFFDEVYLAITRYINFEHIKVLIIASPGYVKDDFVTFMSNKSAKQNDNYYSMHKSKIIKLHASSGYKKSLDEILGSDEISSQLVNFKAIDETKALKRFYDMLGDCSLCYFIQSFLLIHSLFL
jgi:protein pelota